MITAEEPRLEELNEVLLQIESDLGLLDRQLDGVFYWERIRHSVHKEIVKKVYDSELDSPNRGHIGIFKWAINNVAQFAAGLKNLFGKNPFFVEPNDIIFYGMVRRRQLNDGTWYDVHLEPITEIIDEDYMFIEPDGGPLHASTQNRRFLMFPRKLGDLVQNIGYTYEISNQEREVLNQFEMAVEKQLGADVDAVSRVERELSNRRVRLPLYKKIIRRIDPELCFMTYGHSHHSTFVEACHSQDVTVVDVQYCALNKNYWAYHYPGESPRRVKPDYLFLWGKYWKGACALPYKEEDIYITGFPYYERILKEYKQIPTKNQIIFISSPDSGQVVSNVAVELSEMNLQQDVIYKLHGAEFDTWRTDYPRLANAADAGQVTVIDELEGSLHSLLAESKVQVGVSSTALYEGIGFGLPTYIIDVPRSYEMSGVIKNGYAELVQGADEIANSLKHIDYYRSQNDRSMIFKKNSSNNIINAFNQIKNEIN